MSFLLGAALKTVASRLLRNAFTRSTKDTAQEDLDQYRDLDSQFKESELPKSVDSEITPKEQFLNSIGDRGYGLDERDSSLYQRLTEDMKVIVDSNYAISESLNKKLDYTNEAIKSVNENISSVGKIASTYGKMNQEAIIGAGTKSRGKIATFFQGLLEGAKDAILIAVGLVKEAVENLGNTGKGAGPSDPNDSPSVSANAYATDDFIAETEKVAQESWENARKKQKELSSRTYQKVHGYTVAPTSAPKGYTSGIEKAFSTYLTNSGLSYNPELTGSEAFDAFINSFGEGYNSKVYAYYGGSITKEHRDLTDAEKSELWNYMMENREISDEVSESISNAKNAEAAIEEAKDLKVVQKSNQAIATSESRGALSRVFEILRLKGEGEEYYPALKEFISEVRSGKYYSDDDLVQLGIKYKKSNGTYAWKRAGWKYGGGNYGTDDLALWDKIIREYNEDFRLMTGDNAIDLQDFISKDYESEDERYSAIRGILSGDIVVKKDGEVVDPTKISMIDEFNAPYLGLGLSGYGSKIDDSWEFSNAQTGEVIPVSSDWSSVESLSKASDDIWNYKNETLDTTLSELGFTRDSVKEMTQEQFNEMYSKFADLVGPNNDIVLKLLIDIYSVVNRSRGNVVVVPNGTENEVP